MGTKKLPHSASRLDDGVCWYLAWFPKLRVFRFGVCAGSLVWLNVLLNMMMEKSMGIQTLGSRRKNHFIRQVLSDVPLTCA